jgi:hypothetical protein
MSPYLSFINRFGQLSEVLIVTFIEESDEPQMEIDDA